MIRYLLTSFLCILGLSAIAQQKSTIHLVQSTKGVRIAINGADVFKVYNGVFQQKYSTLRSDSAYVYLQNNTFDAFGHVVINQGDTLNIYADKLNYNDNTKIAILTDNVRMVDKDATLTTNYLTYNTATRYGTYTGGGKLVNKDNVLVSKNGYYFAQSRDAYFRYDVVLTTPDALIKTDTLRYNSGSRIAYFYGPTNIYGKKDKDTLYTENGTYNTKTEQAFFGKKNLYKQGTKSLKGDSLFYDRLKGYGKAVKHVTFNDNEQKITIKGNLGEYYKKDDRAVITQNPYVIFVTEEKKDSTKTKTDTTTKATTLTGNPVAPTVKNTMPLKADALPRLKDSLINNQKKIVNKADSLAKTIAALPPVKHTMPVADSAKKIAQQKNQLVKNAAKKAGLPAVTDKLQPATATQAAANDSLQLKPVANDTTKVKRDSMYIGADTLETQIVTYKALKELQKARLMAGIVDTNRVLRKPFVPYKTIPKQLSLDMPKLILQTPSYIGRPLVEVVKTPVDTLAKNAVKDSLQNKLPDGAVKAGKARTDEPGKAANAIINADKKAAVGKPADKKITANGNAKDKLKTDSIKSAKRVLSDTSRVRILSAHHNVHIFKSDLQGKSDSLFYSSSDSIIRSFVKPIYWTQGSQISGDTIFMQLKNKKLDNMDIFPSAFIVNVEDQDSIHFNQAGGKRMKGYFKDNKLALLDIEGNAETIYFNREKGKVTQMQRSLSSGILVHMKNNQMTKISFLIKPDNKYYPISKVKDDDKILKGFIWKPKERPLSKEDVINPKKVIPEKPAAKKDTTQKAPAGKTSTDKETAKKSVVSKTPTSKKTTSKAPVTVLPAKNIVPKDSIAAPAAAPKSVKQDSLAKKDTLKKAPDVKLKQDTVKKR